jgi:DNA-binding beta-propeller fold protein YncE
MTIRSLAGLTLAVALVACASTHPSSTGSKAAASAPTVRSIALPDAPPGGVIMDYLAYDRAHHRVWVPAGNTGAVDVVDVTNDHVSKVDGFATQEMERRGKKRTVGPSSATVGDGVVYVGNRGDFSVCALEAESYKKGACVKLDSMPDALAYVASAKEVWCTTPRDKSINIIDASVPGTLSVKQKISFDGEPEGFSVDDARGIFYTNLEDKDRTLAIDVKTRQVAKTWMPNCGEDGPKGLALDHAQNFLFVACADRVKVLDAGHDGKELSMIETGAGVDDISYVEATHQLYAGAARAAKLTIASVDAQGKLTSIAVVATATGARNSVVTDEGAAYLTDAPEGKILVVSPVSRK